MFEPLTAPLTTKLSVLTPKDVTSTVNDSPPSKEIVKSFPLNTKSVTGLPPEAKPAVLVNISFNCTTA